VLTAVHGVMSSVDLKANRQHRHNTSQGHKLISLPFSFATYHIA